MPILVLTHHVDDGDEPPGAASFVTDVTECAARARAAAGDLAVLVHGAGAAQALLAAGELDELEIRAHRARPGLRWPAAPAAAASRARPRLRWRSTGGSPRGGRAAGTTTALSDVEGGGFTQNTRR